MDERKKLPRVNSLAYFGQLSVTMKTFYDIGTCSAIPEKIQWMREWMNEWITNKSINELIN